MATGESASRASLTALLVASAAAGALLVQPPFAFLSPDGSYHLAKIARAALGDPFRDPVTGTPSLYPPLFHAVWGTTNRILRLPAYDLARFITADQLLGLLVAGYVLGRRLAGPTHGALAALVLPAMFYAPTGRHVLTPAPVNLAIPLAIFGAAFLLLEGTTPRRSFVGGLLLGLAANVVWYMAIPLAAALATIAFLGPRRELRPALAGAALPFAFLALHLLAIRSAWPAYSGYGAAELVRQGGGRMDASAVSEWLLILVTRANDRFLPLIERSRFAQAHYYAAVLPMEILVDALALVLVIRLIRTRKGTPRDPWAPLVVAAVFVILLTLPLAVTRDAPRVAAVQFVGCALLLPPALLQLTRSRMSLVYAALAGLLSLGYTVLHRTAAEAYEVSPAARALIAFIRDRPGHLEERIFVADTNVRQLLVEVPFRSLVGHGHGGYYAQDPASAERMAAAYRSILECRDDWRSQAATFGIRLFAVRHVDPEERAAGECLLKAGRPALQNSEWWVIEVR